MQIVERGRMWKGEGSKSEKVKQKREQDLQGRAQGAVGTGCCTGVCGTATQPWNQMVMQKGVRAWAGRERRADIQQQGWAGTWLWLRGTGLWSGTQAWLSCAQSSLSSRCHAHRLCLTAHRATTRGCKHRWGPGCCLCDPSWGLLAWHGLQKCSEIPHTFIVVWTKFTARKRHPGKAVCMVGPHKEHLILGFATCHSALHSPAADPHHEAELLSPAAGLQSQICVCVHEGSFQGIRQMGSSGRWGWE